MGKWATRKLKNNPICNKHTWTEWKVSGASPAYLIKYCRNCPSTMTIKEFMKYKEQMLLITKKARIQIDLFW